VKAEGGGARLKLHDIARINAAYLRRQLSPFSTTTGDELIQPTINGSRLVYRASIKPD